MKKFEQKKIGLYPTTIIMDDVDQGISYQKGLEKSWGNMPLLEGLDYWWVLTDFMDPNENINLISPNSKYLDGIDWYIPHSEFDKGGVLPGTITKDHQNIIMQSGEICVAPFIRNYHPYKNK